MTLLGFVKESGFNIYNNKKKRMSKYLKDITEVSFYVCSIDNINRNDNTKFIIYDFIRLITFLIINNPWP